MTAAELEAERAASLARRGIRPVATPVRRRGPVSGAEVQESRPGMVPLEKLAKASGQTKRALITAIARREITAVRVRTPRNWRWEVELAEAQRFLASRGLTLTGSSHAKTR